MKTTFLTLFVVTALSMAETANAKLMVHKECKHDVSCIHQRQLQNLKHARYVCHYGRHQTKRWNCAAVKWLKREYRQTEAVLHPPRVLASSDSGAWECIHRYEGAWNSNTGNGYYGGLQMDYGFMRTYGSEFMARWGTADNWPVWAQIQAAIRARDSGRGYGPWPNTARMCGLL
jgi:hypothetical protein